MNIKDNSNNNNRLMDHKDNQVHTPTMANKKYDNINTMSKTPPHNDH